VFGIDECGTEWDPGQAVYQTETYKNNVMGPYSLHSMVNGTFELHKTVPCTYEYYSDWGSSDIPIVYIQVVISASAGYISINYGHEYFVGHRTFERNGAIGVGGIYTDERAECSRPWWDAGWGSVLDWVFITD
jgi:hypothetical protein